VTTKINFNIDITQTVLVCSLAHDEAAEDSATIRIAVMEWYVELEIEWETQLQGLIAA